MQIMKKSLPIQVTFVLILLIPSIAFSIIGYLVFVQLQNESSNNERVEHSKQVLVLTATIQEDILNAETGVRGYLLTGDKTFLEPYYLGVNTLDADIDNLKALTAANPAQQQNLENLKASVTDMNDLFKKKIQIKESGQFDESLIFEGKEKMDGIRTTIEDIRSNANNLLVLRSSDLKETEAFTFNLVLIGFPAAIITSVVSIGFLYSYLKKRIAVESELTHQTRYLREINTEKEEFSAMITHELKTPLIPISGYAELFLDGSLGPINDDQKEKMRVIYESSLRLMTLIQDILDARKLELGRLKLDLRDESIKLIVQRCIDIFKPITTQKNIALVDHTEQAIARCDPDRILQVLNNIISNAIKFVPIVGGAISINSRTENGVIVLSITDNGPGIPKEKQQDLFKRFYQVDKTLTRKSGGTGLGLAISRGIIETHGGKIWVDSEEGHGTTVNFTIPIEAKA